MGQLFLKRGIWKAIGTAANGGQMKHQLATQFRQRPAIEFRLIGAQGTLRTFRCAARQQKPVVGNGHFRRLAAAALDLAPDQVSKGTYAEGPRTQAARRTRTR